jgi:hypothetical protein
LHPAEDGEARHNRSFFNPRTLLAVKSTQHYRSETHFASKIAIARTAKVGGKDASRSFAFGSVENPFGLALSEGVHREKDKA